MFDAAVWANIHYTNLDTVESHGYVSHRTCDTAIYPDSVALRGRERFGKADFGIIYAHGYAYADANDNGYPDAWYDSANAPFKIGEGAEYRVRYDSLFFGGQGSYLKWIWAQSCAWFDVGWRKYDARCTGTSKTLDFSLGRIRLADTLFPWRQWDGTDFYGYRSSGITVQRSGLTGCGSGDWYKRCAWFHNGQGIDPRQCAGCNMLVLKASAPGSANITQGTVKVCLGTHPLEANDSFAPDTSNPLAVFAIKGSGGAATEYLQVLSKNGQHAHLADYFPFCDYSEICKEAVYLVFSGCATDITIHDLWFFYYPPEEPGMTACSEAYMRSWVGLKTLVWARQRNSRGTCATGGRIQHAIRAQHSYRLVSKTTHSRRFSILPLLLPSAPQETATSTCSKSGTALKNTQLLQVLQ